jgi:osmotically-inducible protein OsmY
LRQVAVTKTPPERNNRHVPEFSRVRAEGPKTSRDPEDCVMADRWMDDQNRDRRDRGWRDRDWRDRDWRGDWRGGERRAETYGQGREARSWSERGDPQGGYETDDRDYRTRSGVTSGGGAYRGEGYGGDRSQAYSSAASQACYAPQTPRFAAPDYTGQDYTRQPYAGEGRSAWESGARDIERRGEAAWNDRREGAGDFLQRAGERISSWFHGDDLMRGSHDRADPAREAAQPSRPGHRGRGPKGYQRADERISDEVHDRLTEDSWLDASDIQVEVKGGEVTLSGFVDNREAKHRAERLIEDLSGVRHVQNNLRVKPVGLGSSALEAQMRRDAQASDLSGRTGAAAERSTEAGARRN